MSGDRPIRVLLVDDEALVRAGLRAILEAETDLVVVAEGKDGTDVPALVNTHAPDIVAMDVRMPVIDGITATRHLVNATPTPPRVLVITTFENDEYVYQALHAGADGFVLKRARPDEIVQAVRVVAAGESLLFPNKIRALVAAHSAPSNRDRLASAHLTDREADVLHLMTAGLSNTEIADRLYLGVETVKTHVANILAKVGARDRTQAVIAAYEAGFVSAGR